MMSVLILGLAILAQAPTTPMVGQVVAADGTPVANADLVLMVPGGGGESPPAPVAAKTGEDGRFRLDRRADIAWPRPPMAPRLWATARGHRAEVVVFADKLPGPEEPVRVVLRPPSRTEIRVESPDGRPVAGARARVQQVASDPFSIPGAIGDAAEAVTGPAGIAVLTAFAPEDMTWVDILAEGYGNQPRRFDPKAPGPRVVSLRPVVAVKGRLVPDPPGLEGLQGWRIRVWTNEPPAAIGQPSIRLGYGGATTDAEGAFAIPELAPGSMQVTIVPPAGSKLLADGSKLPTLRPGGPNVLEIPVRKAARLSGLVREKGTGRPVAGMSVHAFQAGRSNGVNMTTDAEGRYSYLSAPGKTRVWAPDPPPGYVRDSNRQIEVDVAADAADVEVPAIELTRAAPPLRGEVVDQDGRPVAGAEVTATWRGDDQALQAQARADDRGRFSLDGLSPGASVTLSARSLDGISPAPTVVEVGEGRSATVKVARRAVVAVAGRVVGTDGRPIEGIGVMLQEQDVSPGRISAPQQVQLLAGIPVRTGADGTFRTAPELPREHRKYRIMVYAPGYEREQSGWGLPGEGGVVTLPDLVLRRVKGLRVVTGRVVDADGNPIAGAAVSQRGDGPAWTEATADAEGRFRLAGVQDGPALAFAEKPGYRFGGVVVGAGPDPVTIRLAATDAPPIPRAGPGPRPTRDEERALGRELLEPILSEGSPEATPALARVDPDRVLAMIENRAVSPSGPAMAAVVVAQAEADPAAAAETIEANRDPVARARLWLALADATPLDGDALRVERLDHALGEARRISPDAARVELLGEIAGRWLDRGDLARATPILREGQAELAKPAPDPGVRISVAHQDEPFAEALAVIDLPAARALFAGDGERKTVMPESVKRHLGEAAVRIAPFRPEEAERLLAENPGGPNPGDREVLVARVARAMGRADLPRARRLLESMSLQAGPNPFPKSAMAPYVIGLIASDLAATEPDRARALLDESFAGLAGLADESRGRTSPPAAFALATLLPTVERVEPDRLVERLWRAAAYRSPRLANGFSNNVSSEASSFAGLVSRYDYAMAAAVAAPAFEAIPIQAARQEFRGYDDGRAIRGLTLHDPRAVAEMIRKLPAAPPETPTNDYDRPRPPLATIYRIAAADVLGRSPRDRLRTNFGPPNWYDLSRLAPSQP